MQVNEVQTAQARTKGAPCHCGRPVSLRPVSLSPSTYAAGLGCVAWEDREAAGRKQEGGDVPFEFVGEVARAGTLAEASDIESGAAAARHVGGVDASVMGGLERGRCWWWCGEDGMATARWKSSGKSCWRNRFRSAARQEPNSARVM